MSKNDRRDHRGRPRPIPVTDAVRDLIRKTAADRHEEPPPAAVERTFTAEGVAWIARVAGEGLGGNGAFASAVVVAVRFHRADDPARPVRETLLPRGRLERLDDDDLAALLLTARPIEPRDAHD